MNKNLERLLEIKVELHSKSEHEFNHAMKLEKEFEFLKSELEEQLENKCNPECKELHKFHENKIKELEQQVKELQEENRQLKFRLADEQDCNQHGECHQIIQDLKRKLEKYQDKYGNYDVLGNVLFTSDCKSTRGSKEMKYQIYLECMLCKLYVILPLEQLKLDSGLFLDNLKCINCQSKLKSSIEVERK